jgi:cytochrome c oxidase assembly factor CtaG
MSPTLDAFLRSWPSDPWLLAALGVTALVYLRGWLALRRRDEGRWPVARLAAFAGGLVVLFLALASPIEPFAGLLLQVHMVQHLLLMMVAPPLLWLGAPMLPMVRGLPRPIPTYWVVPLLRMRTLRGVFGRATHPAVVLPVFVAVTWLWHVPRLYEAALGWGSLHYLQHVCFLASALLFWYPVVRPDPARPRWSPWLLVPCLLLADVSNTVLSALLTFSPRVIYPHYERMPRLGFGGASALDDQATAGVIMWVPGSLVFLVPLFAIGLRLLLGEPRPAPARRAVAGRPRTAAAPPPSPFDLTRLPLLGRFLRWRDARPALQAPILVLALLLIVDGFRGPQVGALNLAGVLPWIHWRGLLVLGLLAAGNVSCLACPFTLPRTLARRWLPAGRRWPRALRNKWPAVALLALFLWAYEAFSLWDRPRWTAWIILGYFAAAFVVDGLFRGASFCKHVCPIGQFSFVQAQLSPLEVAVRSGEVCASCRTRDCIRGRASVPGCELGLFQPRKAGNLDCTFCLDCVHACPHENVGILAVVPVADLTRRGDPARSGLGRLSRRRDLAALIVLLAYGGFANAAGMVGPVLDWQDALAGRLRLGSPHMMTAVFALVTLIGVPSLLHATASVLSRRWGRLALGWPEVATRFAYALVPLGFGMWLAHTSFHFLTSWGTVVPTSQRFAADLGLGFLGQPQWGRSCCRPASEWLLHVEIFFLDAGLLLSLYTAYRIGRDLCEPPTRALKALAPWAVVIVLLFAVGVWLVLQPMQMRGTLPGAG